MNFYPRDGNYHRAQCNENMQFTELHQRSGKNTTVVA